MNEAKEAPIKKKIKEFSATLVAKVEEAGAKADAAAELQKTLDGELETIELGACTTSAAA